MDRMLFALALFATVVVAGIIAGIATTGIGQDLFQVARPIETSIAYLMQKPDGAVGLRLNLGLDNLFILIYAAYFLVLAARFRSTMDPLVRAVALGAMLFTALLDAIENHHIAVMLQSIQQHMPLDAAESQFQMVVTSLKFHVSYFGIALFASGFFKEGGIGRAIAVVMWLYVLLGVVALAMPPEAIRPFVLGRTGFFIASFILAALMFRPKAVQTR